MLLEQYKLMHWDNYGKSWDCVGLLTLLPFTQCGEHGV